MHSVENLELLISLLFEKALAEPHYCETYTEMVVKLQKWIPPLHDQTGNLITFKSALLKVTQNEFESMFERLEIAEEVSNFDPEEVEHLRKKRKDRVVANMKFIGQLFVRCLVSFRVINAILLRLAGCDHEARVPDELVVECICELLVNIGSTLEATLAGRETLNCVFARLQDLKALAYNGTRMYSTRVQFVILDVEDMRGADWKKKSCKALAKTKNEIRKEHEKDARPRKCR